jgi:oligopeptide transport system substrate-binding protein
VKIKKAVALLLAAVMAFSFTACKSGKAKKAGKTIRYYLESDPQSLDPQVASDSSSLIVVQSLFEGLTRLDEKEEVQPGVAEKWESNSDSTQFTFHLRKGAKWSNSDYGDVTASDFVYAFRRAVDPATGSPACTQFYCIKNAKSAHEGKVPVSSIGVEAKDARTLVVTLEYSCPDFPRLTASPAFMPCNQKFFESTKGRYGIKTKYVMGNGPFRIDGSYGWTQGKSVNLVSRSSYSGRTTPLPEKIIFTIDNSSAVKTDPIGSMKTLSLDAVPIAASKVNAAKKAGCTIASVEDTTWGLGFNVQSSLFQNEKVRRAFIQALDRSAVLAHLPADTSPAENIILPNTRLNGQLYRSLVGGPFYLRQDENAASLLAQGLKELGGAKVDSVTLLCPNDSANKLVANEMIAAWNDTFNNYFNLKPMDTSSLLSAVKSGQYDLAIYPLTPSADGPYFLLSQFLSTNSNNPAGLKDASYDALIASAQSTGGSEEAAEYASAEKYLNEKAIFYPLYYGKSYYAIAKGVTGIIFHPYGGGVDFINAGKE